MGEVFFFFLLNWLLLREKGPPPHPLAQPGSKILRRQDAEKKDMISTQRRNMTLRHVNS